MLKSKLWKQTLRKRTLKGVTLRICSLKSKCRGLDAGDAGQMLGFCKTSDSVQLSQISTKHSGTVSLEFPF